MSTEQTTQANIDYWMSQRELCLTVAKDVEASDSQPPFEVRRIVKDYRTAASRWRRAATYAASDDPISRDLAEAEAEAAARIQGRAEAKLSEHDGADAPLSPPTALPIPESLGHTATVVGIEVARPILGDLASRVKHTGAKIVLTKNGKPVADIVPHVAQESAMAKNRPYEAARRQMLQTATEAIGNATSAARAGKATALALGILFTLANSKDGLGRLNADSIAAYVQAGVDAWAEMVAPGDQEEQLRLTDQAWSAIGRQANPDPASRDADAARGTF